MYNKCLPPPRLFDSLMHYRRIDLSQVVRAGLMVKHSDKVGRLDEVGKLEASQWILLGNSTDHLDTIIGESTSGRWGGSSMETSQMGSDCKTRDYCHQSWLFLRQFSNILKARILVVHSTLLYHVSLWYLGAETQRHIWSETYTGY